VASLTLRSHRIRLPSTRWKVGVGPPKPERLTNTEGNMPLRRGVESGENETDTEGQAAKVANGEGDRGPESADT